MLASRKIFLGASALVTGQLLNLLGAFTAKRAADLLGSRPVSETSNGLTFSVLSPADIAAKKSQASNLIQIADIAGSVSLVLATLGLLLVLTGLYQLAVLVESGGSRPDGQDRSP